CACHATDYPSRTVHPRLLGTDSVRGVPLERSDTFVSQFANEPCVLFNDHALDRVAGERRVDELAHTTVPADNCVVLKRLHVAVVPNLVRFGLRGEPVFKRVANWDGGT